MQKWKKQDKKKKSDMDKEDFMLQSKPIDKKKHCIV